MHTSFKLSALLLGAALAALSATGQESPPDCPDIAGASLCGTALLGTLCVNGHPARRSPNVTYAGLPPRHGYQRDHVWPLCLGGPDTRGNLQYQPLEEARAKDRLEWETCEAYCRGEITLDQGRARFSREYK